MTAECVIKLSEKMQGMSENINNYIEVVSGEKQAFVLVVAPFNTNSSRMNYTSNANREDMIDMLSALVEGLKKGKTDGPAHELDNAD